MEAGRASDVWLFLDMTPRKFYGCIWGSIFVHVWFLELICGVHGRKKVYNKSIALHLRISVSSCVSMPYGYHHLQTHSRFSPSFVYTLRFFTHPGTSS